MNIGDLVRIHTTDIDGLDFSGMSGVITSLSPLYASVRLTSTGAVVMVPLVDLSLVDPSPVSVRQFRSMQRTWMERNRRVVERMRRAAA